MDLSIFTPTHDPYQLARAAASIKAQERQPREWVVLVNGDAKVDEVKAIVAAVPQARVLHTEMSGIGALKKLAALSCTGDVVVELDHDDELTPRCLARLGAEFEADPTLTFCYSDCAELRSDGTANVYPPSNGWTTYTARVGDRELLVQRAFDPSPASFSRVWYGPNHVRAWRRDFYERIGGHDERLEVLDDHDLVARTFIHGKVKRIDECLYVYHWTDRNTSQSVMRNPEIQVKTLEVHDRYIQAMVERWARDEGKMLVDLCSGDHCPPGWTPTDKRMGVDLDKPWPWRDSTVAAFRAYDALEHLRDPLHTMKEIYRCLVPGGWLLSETPSTDGRGAFQDPTHVSFWNSNSFWYYYRAEQASFIGTPVRFQAVRLHNHFPSDFHRAHNVPYVRAHLVSLKDGHRPPGFLEI